MYRSRAARRLGVLSLMVATLGTSVVPAAAASPVPEPAASAAAEAAPAPPLTTGPTAEPAAPAELSFPEPPPPEPPPGVEAVELRTASSRTFERPDGAFTSELYPAPVFYQPDGAAGGWQPIQVGFRAGPAGGPAAVSDRAPVSVTLQRTGAPGGFLSLTDGRHPISFRLPLGVTPGNPAARPALAGARADFPDFLSGGIDLRVIALAQGAKSFLVLHERPPVSSFSFLVHAPGLTLTVEPDGSLAFRDPAGDTVATMPRPYAVDSDTDLRLGSGAYRDAVTLSVAGVGGLQTVTLSVDPAFLDAASYPVYLDPSTSYLVPGGSNAYGDAFVSAKYPTHNYATYTRPDEPYYHEHWLGRDPTNSTNVNAVFLRFDLSGMTGRTVDDATLQVFPYHQYYNAPTATRTWLDTVDASWAENTLTWDTRPSTSALTSADLVEGQTGSFAVTDAVAGWVYGATSNFGFKLHENSQNGTYWKRLISSEQGGTMAAYVPKLVIEWHRPVVVLESPIGGAITSSRALSWSYSDEDDAPQSHYTVELSTASDFSTILKASGEVASSATSWTIPSAVPLTGGQTYYWRAQAKNGTGWSVRRSSSFRWDPDAPPLVAELSSPAEGQHVRGVVSITGTAAGGDFASYTLQRRTNCTTGTLYGVGSNPRTSPVTDGELGSWDTGTINGSRHIRLTVSSATSSLVRQICVVVDNSSPTGSLANAPLSGDAQIMGTAKDNLGFADYSLEWGAGSAPSTWNLVEPSKPSYTVAVPSRGVLGTWKTGTRNGLHTLRLTIRDRAGNVPTVVTQTVYLENSRRGDESYLSRVPFDLGGGLSMAVGVANGELTLERHLFHIPSYGPPQELALRYSSLNTSSAGRFGTGWSSNLTQYLTFPSGFVVWERPDGGRVAFADVNGTWTPAPGHYETLSYDSAAGSYTITQPDQTRLVFGAAAPGRLLRVENRFGVALTLSWGTSSATATDASGRATTLTIDGSSRVTGATDSAGRPWAFTYNNYNRLTSLTDPESAVTTFGYDSNSRLTSVTRSRTAADGTSETIAWTVAYATGGVSQVRDPIGGTSYPHTFSYDLAERFTTASLVKDIDTGERNVSEYTYDRRGRVTLEVGPQDGLGERWTTASSYDPNGNLLSIRLPIDDTTSATTSYTYDTRGNLLSEVAPVEDAQTTTTTWTYNSTNDVTLHTEAAGTALEVRTAYSYLSGDLTRMELNPQLPAGDPARVATTYTYYAGTHLVEVETDPQGVVTKYEYDSYGNQTKLITNYVPGGTGADQNLTTTYQYVAATTAGRAGLVTTELQPGGTTIERSYDDLGQQLSETVTGTALGSGLTGAETYDSFGNTLTETVGGVVTERTYDANGQLIKEVRDPGGLALTTEYAYNAHGNQTATKDARGMVTRSVYDGHGQVTKTIVNCTDSGTIIPSDWAACAGTGTADATWNLVTTYTYDAHGNQTQVIAPNGRVTRTGYDSADRLVWQTDNYVAGTPTAADQNLTSSFYHDELGRQVATRTPTADRDTFLVARSFYDELGRVSKEIANCTDTGTSPPVDPASCTGLGSADAATNIVTSYSYDERGNRLSLTAPSPAATSGTDSATVTTLYAYDDHDRLCRVLENATVDLQTLTDPCTSAVSGTTTSDVSTRYSYDPAGNLTSMVDARGNTTLYGYDGAGRMTSRTDPLGETLSYGYDERGNRLRQTNRETPPPFNGVVSWTYDNADRMTGRTADGLTVSYGYDAAGNQTSAQGPAGTIASTFDRLGRPLTVIAEDGSSTSYSYGFTSAARTDPSGSYSIVLDVFGRETSLTDPIHATPFTTSYRADGRLLSQPQPNGNITSYGYDRLGRLLTKNTTAAGLSSRAAYTYSYNRASLRLAEASTIDGDPTNGTASFGYDPLGRLIGYTPPTTTAQSYAWQGVPNRESITTGGSTLTTSYDSANRPSSDSSGGSYSHDHDGRLTARPGQILEWDTLGRLTTVKDASGVTLSGYTYDALDRLRTVARSESTIRFRYLGTSTQAAEILDHATGASERKVAHTWAGERLLDWTSSERRFYGTNGHFDTTWTADTTGAVSATLRYDPWGALIASTGTSVPDWRFQGSWLDTATTGYWVVTRWYLPELARFVSDDNLLGAPSLPVSRHLSAYANGDPISGHDKDGRFTRYSDKFVGIGHLGSFSSTTRAWYMDPGPPWHADRCGGGAYYLKMVVSWGWLSRSWIQIKSVRTVVTLSGHPRHAGDGDLRIFSEERGEDKPGYIRARPGGFVGHVQDGNGVIPDTNPWRETYAVNRWFRFSRSDSSNFLRVRKDSTHGLDQIAGNAEDSMYTALCRNKVYLNLTWSKTRNS